SVGSTHHLEVVFVWKQNYILVDEYFFFCCTWIVNSAGKNNLLRRLNALKRADFSHHAVRIRCPVQIICASDDLLVPSACSSELHAALPDSQKMVMRYGGHACNVTDPETFNALLLNGLASLLHHREAAL
ncbi:alpha/beta hydrolase, partial [Escherichia coli]|uniref:alpha/beta fold hydrolase n=1 Tax=Escherichia coli TaxID=562 RepID=UPI0028742E61